MLESCLRSILDDGSRLPREVIVVDNGSSDATADVIRRFTALAPDVFVHETEPRRGKVHALNRGVGRARGEFLLFTDDDVVVQPGWTEALVNGFSDAAVAAVAGRILPQWPVDPPGWLCGPQAVLLTLVDFGTEARRLHPGEWPMGANMALRRDVVRAAGPAFEESLGNIGVVQTAHEETYFFQALRGDQALVYRPDALVHHMIQASRMDWAWIRSTYFQRGFGLARIERLDGRAQPPLPVGLVRSLRVYLRARRLRRRNLWATQPGPEAAWEEFYAFMWAGKTLEGALGGFPALTGWLALHLA